jgi:shikimate dehydrogenase
LNEFEKMLSSDLNMASFLMPIPEGGTRIYAVLGDPVDQVQAPHFMNRIFRDGGVDAVMVPVHVSPMDLPTVLKGLQKIRNLDGILVTIPHKFAVCDFIDKPSAMVQLTGAANALRRGADGRWEGENFDGRGFVAGLQKNGHTISGNHVAMVGTGGAGVAIAAALVDSGVATLAVTDLSADKANQLVVRLNAMRPGVACFQPQIDWSDIDIAINATPMGLQEEDPLPFDVAALRAGTVVAEVIMKPPQTRLLTAAAERGLAIYHGIHMLSSQIDLYRAFFGIDR